jgi:hypothetical protein
VRPGAQRRRVYRLGIRLDNSALAG